MRNYIITDIGEIKVNGKVWGDVFRDKEIPNRYHAVIRTNGHEYAYDVFSGSGNSRDEAISDAFMRGVRKWRKNMADTRAVRAMFYDAIPAVEAILA